MRPRALDFQDYKAFLKAYEKSLPQGGRGFRSGLARLLGCQNAYISQVLNASNDLTNDQAFLVSEHLNLDDRETRHFLLSVQEARAAQYRYKAYLREQKKNLVEEDHALKNRIQVKDELGDSQKLEYYSDWSYSAVHVLTSIPEFQTSDAMALHLGLARRKTQNILKFLTQTGLVIEEKPGRYVMGTARVHLKGDHSLIAHHHTNWRLAALRSLEQDADQMNLHYSSVVSVSSRDAEEIRKQFLQVIDDYNARVSSSKEEELRALTLDFFSPSQRT